MSTRTTSTMADLHKQHQVDDVLTRLHAHLHDLHEYPDQRLDAHLFDEAEIVLPHALQGDDSEALLQRLASSLMHDAGDATPKVNLLVKLFGPYTWTQICDFSQHVHQVPFKQGLTPSVDMVPINRLMLVLLSKAALSPADAAHLATMLDPDPIIYAVVDCWLRTPDVGIATQSQQLLIALLEVDREASVPDDTVLDSRAAGQGLVWKRIFGDRDVYALFYAACSLTSIRHDGFSVSQISIAQARLLAWLPEVGAMDWTAISKSHHQDVERTYGVSGGLLDFAALHMVDKKSDLLMHICLIDFLSSLLRITLSSDGEISRSPESPSLHYVLAKGLHPEAAAPYVQLPQSAVDPLESTLLYGPSANYVATYALHYPVHYMRSELSKHVRARLTRALDLSLATWTHSESPRHDLHVLASLPRKALMGPQNNSLLSLLPSRARNADMFSALAAVFHGPPSDHLRFPPLVANANAGDRTKEACYARGLYFHYLAENPLFWRDLVAHADTVALKDVALAAIQCMLAVITANWSTETEPISLPNAIACPESGTLAILSPPALEHTLPYLLKPPRTFANLVGGKGDAESAAYKVAMAKMDAVRAMQQRVSSLNERQPGEGYDAIATTLGKRLQDGIIGREEDMGGRVGTLES